ncbi:MAG TPA: hypothetical protein VKY80_07970 [Croceibacterium sp.]|nr:hypothetical protein [Croceibacterium sp.]
MKPKCALVLLVFRHACEGLSSQDGASSGDELVKLEGLSEDIVGPSFEACHVIIAGSPGSDHDDRHARVHPDCVEQRQTRWRGNINREDDDSDAPSGQPVQRVLAARMERRAAVEDDAVCDLPPFSLVVADD